jgi:hypothetical protein
MKTMTLSDSMVYVLKHRRKNLLKNLWKEDVKNVLADFKDDVFGFIKSNVTSFKELRQNSLRDNWKEVRGVTGDSVAVLRAVPNRLRLGIRYFQQDLADALETFPDQSQKSIFTLKVIGVLCRFTMSTLSGIQKASVRPEFQGLRIKSAFTQMIAAEILVRFVQVFTLRFIQEMENQLSNKEEVQKLEYLKAMLVTRDKNEVYDDVNVDVQGTDLAFSIVESFRNYLLTGKRVAP